MLGKRKRPASSWGKQGGQKRARGGAGGSSFRPSSRFGGSRALQLHPRRTASQVIIRQPSSLPDRLYVKLRYREQLSWTQLSGDLGDNVYRGNSCFDPDLTGTGGQPLGFDQWSTFYGYYTVLGSKIEVSSMHNGGGSGANMARVGIVPTNISTAFAATDREVAEETPYAQWKHLTMAATGCGQAFQKSYMSTAKMEGSVRAAIQIADSYSALTTANPAAPWFWHVCNYVPSGSTQSLFQNVVLTYYVVFEGRRQLALS